MHIKLSDLFCDITHCCVVETEVLSDLKIFNFGICSWMGLLIYLMFLMPQLKDDVNSMLKKGFHQSLVFSLPFCSPDQKKRCVFFINHDHRVVFV